MRAPRTLRSGDEAALVAVLARAFRDNPLNRAVIRGDARRRLRSNLAGMRVTVASARQRCRVWVAPTRSDVPSGGLIAMAPGTWPLPPPSWLDQLRVLVGQGVPTARRWGDVFESLRASHPVEPHWYLALLGVDPVAQACGRGASLVSRWLEEVDADGVPAYLETDRAELLAFYGRFGFMPVGSERLFGVDVYRLRRRAGPRDPRRGRGATGR